MFNILPFQEPLRRAIPEVKGCKDYRDEEQLLERVDQILIHSGLEDLFLQESLQEYQKRKALNPQGKEEQNGTDGAPKPQDDAWLKRYQINSRQALRCSILKHLTGESFRVLSKQLAMSPLYQWFCRCENFEEIRVPSKSRLQEYSNWLPIEEMQKILNHLTAALSDSERAEELGIEHALDLSYGWVDSTCLKANIHFPTDWILLKDAARTLLASIVVIRKHGLLHRIGEPAQLMSRINSICMAMAAAGRNKAGGKKDRKAKFRDLDSLSKVIQRHGRRYRDLLDEKWETTDLSRRQAEVILRRMDQVLDQLPEARRQARERIIGERKVENSEKILSLYESEVHVIVRHKAGATVEFGNSLFVVESAEGFIMDHELCKETSPGDAQWLGKRVEKLREATGGELQGLVGDRGFASKANSKKLEDSGLCDVLCPRDPKQLAEKLKSDENFARATRRRAQTEGRIAILKNVFLDGTPRAQGFASRQLQVAWAVLAHNLWVAARLPRKQEQEEVPLAA